MLWLRNIDLLSRALPAQLLRLLRSVPKQNSVCILRPGGLGDLVLLTRAMQQLGFSAKDVTWLVESRNSIWLSYLGIPFNLYHSIDEMWSFLAGSRTYEILVNTEQLHGLAAVASFRRCHSSSTHIGFSSNPRADLFDTSVFYGSKTSELDLFKQILLGADKLKPFERGQIEIPEIQNKDVPKNYTLVAIGGLQEKEKTLPVEDWVKLVELASEVAETVFLVGAPVDQSFSELVVEKSRVRCESLLGHRSFSEVVDLIRGAKGVWSVDSGLAHVAEFFDIPSFTIFPKDNMSKWRSHSRFSTAVSLEQWASFNEVGE